MEMLYLLFALAIGYGIFAVFLGLATVRTPDAVQLRLDHYGTRIRTLEEIELERTFGNRIIKPFLRQLARLPMRFVPQLDLNAIRLKLDMAGNPANLSPADFLGARCLAAFLYAAVPFGIMVTRGFPIFNVIFYTVFSGGLGFYLPVLWLRIRIKSRQKEIQARLPDALDLMTVSVEAGLSFETAMAKAAEYADNQLSRAFARVLAEIQLGVPEIDALRN